MNVVINPGSGPVSEATEENATANMEAFANDLRTRGIGVDAIVRRTDKDYGDGRYAFNLVRADQIAFEVQMPGLPLDRVRWLGSDQDIWQFPRLYVDDSSWVWFFALNQFEGDDYESRQPNNTVDGGEPYRFETIRPGDAEVSR